MYILFGLLATSRFHLAAGDVACFDVEMHTPTDCDDDPDYIDAQGYPCAAHKDYDCWADNLQWGYSEDDVKDVIFNCPTSCGLCTPDRMKLELIDSSTNALPVFEPNSTFTGIGPRLKAPSTTVVTQSFCVLERMCIQFGMVAEGDEAAQIQALSRTAFELFDASTNEMIVSKSRSGEMTEVCVSNCTANEPFNVLIGDCSPCAAGSFPNPIFNLCEKCPRNTYSHEGSIECSPCPPHIPFSHEGATSVEKCMTLGGNLYTTSQNNRVAKYNYDHDTHENVVVDYVNLNAPKDLAFINNRLFAVSNYYGNGVDVYDIDSSYIGRLFDVANPVGILMLPSGELAVVSGGDNCVYVLDISNALQVGGDGIWTITPLSEDGVIFKSTPISNPRYMTFGSDETEVLVTTVDRKVERRCISTSCSAGRNKLMLTSSDSNTALCGIASVSSIGSYFVANGAPIAKVYKCNLGAAPNKNLEDTCEVFVASMFDPWAIVVDEVKEIIYVADAVENEIVMFDYEGTLFGHLGSSGALNLPSGLAFRPGHYAPVSNILDLTPSMTSIAVAGRLITFPVVLQDSHGNLITTVDPVRPEYFSFEMEGEITVIGDKIPITFYGALVQTEDVSLMRAEVSCNFQGEFTLSIMEEVDAVPTHLNGSPFTLIIIAAETKPSKCVISNPSSVIAGEDFRIVVQSQPHV